MTLFATGRGNHRHSVQTQRAKATSSSFFDHVSRATTLMTVSLDYDPASPAPSGISRLRRLASFGRYGADVHAAARTNCSTKPSVKHRNRKEDCSVLAASLSSFYGWLVKQTGSKAILGHQVSNSKHRLQAQKQVSCQETCSACIE